MQSGKTDARGEADWSWHQIIDKPPCTPACSKDWHGVWMTAPTSTYSCNSLTPDPQVLLTSFFHKDAGVHTSSAFRQTHPHSVCSLSHTAPSVDLSQCSIGCDRSYKPQVHTQVIKCSASRKQGCYTGDFFFSSLLRALWTPHGRRNNIFICPLFYWICCPS